MISCFAGIEFVYGDFWLKQLFYESNGYANHTAKHVLSGKDSDRALRAFLIVDEALNRRSFVNCKLWLEQQHNEKLTDEIMKEVSSFLSGTPEGETDFVNLVLGKIDADICPMIKQLRLEGRKTTPLLKFWNDYLTKVPEPLKLYLASS